MKITKDGKLYKYYDEPEVETISNTIDIDKIKDEANDKESIVKFLGLGDNTTVVDNEYSAYYDYKVTLKNGTLVYFSNNEVIKKVLPDGSVELNYVPHLINQNIFSVGGTIASKKIIQPDGTVTYYSESGEVEKIEYNDGTNKYYFRHKNGQLRKIVKYNSSDKIIESTEYDENGNLIKEKLSDGTSNEYDENGNLILKHDSDGTIYEYKDGNTKISYKNNNFNYDCYKILNENGTIIEQKFDNGRIVKYDSEGYIEKVIYSDGIEKIYTSDGYTIVNQKCYFEDETRQEWTSKVVADDKLNQAINRKNYNRFFYRFSEYYDNDGNIKYVELAGAGIHGAGGENDYAKIYPDGSCEYASYGDKSHTISYYNSDGSKREVEYIYGEDESDIYKTKETYYDKDGNATLKNVNGVKTFERAESGDEYHYFSDGDISFISYNDGSRCDIKYNSDGTTCHQFTYVDRSTRYVYYNADGTIDHETIYPKDGTWRVISYNSDGTVSDDHLYGKN